MSEEGIDTQSIMLFIIFGSIILLALSSVVSYEFGLFLKDLREAKFNLIYLLLALIPLAVLVYYSNYKFHNKIFKKNEDKKQKEAELEKQEEHLEELLDNEFCDDSEELQNRINEVEELQNDLDDKILENHEEDIINWLEQAKEELKIKIKEERLWEIREEKKTLNEDINDLKTERQKLLREKDVEKREIKKRLDVEKNNVFVRKELNEKEIKVLKEEGFEHANENDIVEQEIITVLVKKILNHSKTHTFLVWSVRQFLEELEGVKNIKEHETKYPDLTFKYKDKEFAMEIETGNLLRKKKQALEKIKFLNRKYGKRWIFVVSNKNLLPAYRKMGLATQRSEVARKLKKWLKSTT